VQLGGGNKRMKDSHTSFKVKQYLVKANLLTRSSRSRNRGPSLQNGPATHRVVRSLSIYIHMFKFIEIYIYKHIYI